MFLHGSFHVFFQVFHVFVIFFNVFHVFASFFHVFFLRFFHVLARFHAVLGSNLPTALSVNWTKSIGKLGFGQHQVWNPASVTAQAWPNRGSGEDAVVLVRA